jgi:hypothetical protein
MDTSLSGAVEDLRTTILPEVIPGPLDKGFDLRTAGRQERDMHADPRGETDDAFEFVPASPDFRNRGISPDHRHDAEILVVEGLPRAALDVSGDILRAPLARLLRDRSQLGERLAVCTG